LTSKDRQSEDQSGVETIDDGRKSPARSEELAQFPNYVPAGARGATRASDQRTMIADGEYVEAPADDDAESTVMVKKDYLDDQKTILRDPAQPSGGEAYDPNATVLASRPPPTATEIGSPVPPPALVPKASGRPAGKHAPLQSPEVGAREKPAPLAPAPARSPRAAAAGPPPRPPRGAPARVTDLPPPPTEEVRPGQPKSGQSLPVRTWILLLVTAGAAFVIFFGESFGIDVFGTGAQQTRANTQQTRAVAADQSKQPKSNDSAESDAPTPDNGDVIASLTLPSETSEKLAAEALLQGKKREALGYYVVLARQHPDNDAFAAMVTILARQERSR
jgi:hypothetical protein